MTNDDRLDVRKCTPGPWSKCGKNGVHVWLSDHYAACVATTEGDCREHNARLIAEAGTTADRTGKSPSQLAGELDALVEAVIAWNDADARPVSMAETAQKRRDLIELVARIKESSDAK